MAEAKSEVRNMQFRKIKADPTSYYARPDDVVNDERFETPQKVDILRQWGADLLKLDPESIAEPRPEGELRRIARAIERLGADPGEHLKSRSG